MYKLWVVGESSSDPDDWSEWGYYELVIAKDREEALKVAGRKNEDYVAEVLMDKAKYLTFHASSDPMDYD